MKEALPGMGAAECSGEGEQTLDLDVPVKYDGC